MKKLRLKKLKGFLLFGVMVLGLSFSFISAEGGHTCVNNPPIDIVWGYFGCDTIETVGTSQWDIAHNIPPTGETGKCYWKVSTDVFHGVGEEFLTRSEGCCWSSRYWDNPGNWQGGGILGFQIAKKLERPWDFGLRWKVVGDEDDHQACCMGPKEGPIQKYIKNDMQLPSFYGQVMKYECCDMLWKDQEPEIKKTYQGLVCKGEEEYANKEICCPAKFKKGNLLTVGKIIEPRCDVDCLTHQPICDYPPFDECNCPYETRGEPHTKGVPAVTSACVNTKPEKRAKIISTAIEKLGKTGKTIVKECCYNYKRDEGINCYSVAAAVWKCAGIPKGAVGDVTTSINSIEIGDIVNYWPPGVVQTKYTDHSVIFAGWKDKEKKEMYVYNNPGGSDRKWRYEVKTIAKITSVHKPKFCK